MARGNVNKVMINSAEKLDISEIAAAATIFNADINYRSPKSQKNVLEIVTDLDLSKVNELYAIEGFKNKATVQMRLVFDVGSGATKTGLYLVDTTSNKIIKLINTLSLSFGYQACATGNSGVLSNSCMQDGLNIMKAISEFYEIDCSLVSCAGLATAWARNAQNSLDYINNYLIPNNYHIYPITQLQEGKLGVEAVVANTNINIPDKQKILVWDIGGGSFQLGLYKQDNSIYIYNGPYGSANFQGLLTSNSLPATPLNSQEVIIAKSIAHDAISQYLSQDQTLLDKTSYAKVYAIGSLMNLAIKPLSGKSVYSKQDIENLIAEFFVGSTSIIDVNEFQNKFPNINPSFFNVIQSNLLLVNTIMEGANINEIEIFAAISTDPMAVTNPVEVYPSGITINNIWDFS